MHYQRLRKKGTTGDAEPGRGGDPVARFWTKVDKNGPVPSHRPELGQCWLWTATKSNGYGMFSLNSGMVLAPRYAYELTHGSIGDRDLDHLCRNPSCVNPDHLEPVTHRENVLRGIGPTAMQAAQTHCKRGHPFDEENTYIIPTTGSRQCRTCVVAYRPGRREIDNARRRERRAQLRAG